MYLTRKVYNDTNYYGQGTGLEHEKRSRELNGPASGRVRKERGRTALEKGQSFRRLALDVGQHKGNSSSGKKNQERGRRARKKKTSRTRELC